MKINNHLSKELKRLLEAHISIQALVTTNCREGYRTLIKDYYIEQVERLGGMKFKALRTMIYQVKSWNEALFKKIKETFPKSQWTYIKTKNELNFEHFNKLKPTKKFIPHWSYIIPEKIFAAFECIVFHMTDLPHGRGGSPLQDLIISGHSETMISALRVEKGIHTGPI